MAFRLAIDTGGTFTDFVLIDDDSGALQTLKTTSTPPEFADGVIRGLDLLNVPLEQIRYIFHGSTMGVNALIEGRGEAVALLTTDGFEDALEIGWMNKPDMYNLLYTKPPPLVPRRLRKSIRERIGRHGDVLEAVSRDEVIRVVEGIVDQGIRSVAVCTINSYLNPVNERAIARIIRESFSSLHVSVSTEIIPQRREFERTSTTVLNAYLVPTFHRYFGRLEEELEKRGFAGEFFVMKSNGGIMPLRVARAYPIHTLLSGPVGGAIGAREIGRRLGLANIIGFDMGGTSTDVSLIHAGMPQMTDQAMVHGYPVMGAVIDIGYIGAGGGSMATVEGISSLRVGPQSAGAVPGPVCYDRGGKVACVTDANLVLGRLDEETPLADAVVLHLDKAQEAIQNQLAGRLGLSRDRAALGVVKIAEVKMAHAIRRVTIEQGLDPRDFVLVAFGGAGPMHAASIAAQVGIPRVIVPPSPGTFSAWGMLSTHIRHDTVRTVDHAGRTVTLEALRETFQSLEQEAGDFLERQDVSADRISFLRSVDARYKGQEHTISVPFPDGSVSEEALARFLDAFHTLHERKYAHSRPGASVEVIHVRVAGFGRLPIREAEQQAEPTPNKARPLKDRVRGATFEEWSGEVPVYLRNELRAGAEITGPAIVLEYGSTTVLPPDFALKVDVWGNLVIELGAGSL